MKGICADFLATVDAIYGAYLDATSGFRWNYKHVIEQQEQSVISLRTTNPELATIEYLDTADWIYVKGDPSEPGFKPLHRSTQRDYKKRNVANGENYTFLANVCVISIYQDWEDEFRRKIAEAQGLTKADLKCSIMGDLRLLRHSIIHHAGVALPEVGQAELLKWFGSGDLIAVNELQMEAIVDEVKSFIVGLLGSANSQPSHDGTA